MDSARTRVSGGGARAWSLAVLLVATLALCAACGGKEPSRSGAGVTLGAAEGTVSGAPATTADPAAARPADLARTVATAQAMAQAQASGADPCRVVMKEELEAALGFPLGPGERRAGPIGDEQCIYRAQFDRTSGTIPNVTVAIYRSRLAGTTYDGVRENAPGRATDVPGLGDKASVSVGSGLLDSRIIYVLKGDVLLSIDVVAEGGANNPSRTMNEEEKRAKLIALARTALGRL